MKMAIVKCACALLIAMVAVRGQVTSTQTHTFPFAGCQSVTSDGDAIFMSTGAGIYVLNGSADEPVFITSPTGVKSKLNAGGLVRDINLSDSYVYAAATRNGLARFERPTMDAEPDDRINLTSTAEAWAVTHQQVGTTDVVIVGTNTSDAGGTIELVWSTSGGLELKASRSVGGPVYCLASTIDTVNDKLVVLVGTACSGGTTSPDAVQEFDIDISGGVPDSIPAEPVATWSVMEGSSPVATLARDIVIDPSGGTAFVAAHTRGIHRLSIGDLSETVGYGWPVLCESDACRYQGLSIVELAPGEYVLAAGLGLPFPTDRQEWGACSELATCADPETDAEASQESSVQIYSATGTANLLATISARGSTPPLGGVPVRLAARAGSDSDHFFIDVAALQQGMRVVEAIRDEADEWSLEEVGRLDQDFASEDLPLANFDDLAILQDTVVAAVESGIVTFDGSIDTSSDQLLSAPSAYVHTGAVWTTVVGSGTGPGHTGTFPAMIFACNQTSGVRFIQPTISGGVVTSMADLLSLDTNGKPFAARAFPAGSTPDGYPWLFVANFSDQEATGECTPRLTTGAIRVYRLKKDVHGQVAPNVAVQIGAWIPFACSHSEFDGQRGELLDLWVEPDGSSNFTIWATYGDRSTNTPGIGVVAIDAEWVTSPAPPHVVCSFLGKAQVSNEPTSKIGRIQYRSGSLFASFGCEGVATFSASPGSTPSLLKSLSISGKSVLGVAHGASGDTNMYVACLNGPIVVVDTTTTPMSTLMTIPTVYQPQALLLAPSDTSGPAFFVADGAGGLHRIQLSATP